MYYGMGEKFRQVFVTNPILDICFAVYVCVKPSISHKPHLAACELLFFSWTGCFRNRGSRNVSGERLGFNSSQVCTGSM